MMSPCLSKRHGRGSRHFSLKVFYSWPIQKSHLVKIFAGHFMDPLFEIEMERPIPRIAGRPGYEMPATEHPLKV